METRDQWYKPNLLYNIHYRPSIKPEPPMMIVETVQFNPSVCTCGEHGCQPQYRMEKRVLWTNKEARNANQLSNVKERENKYEHRENKFQRSITAQNRKIGSVTESIQIGLKEEGCQEHRYTDDEEGNQMGLKEEIGQKCFKEGDASKQMELKEEKYRFIEDDGNRFGAAERFQEKMSGDFEVGSGYKAIDAVNENESIEVQGNDDDNEEKEEEKKEKCDFKNEFGCSESKDGVCIDEEASNTNNIKENNSNGRTDRDYSEGENSEGVYIEKIIGNDYEIVYCSDCKGDGKGYNEGQIDKDHTTGEGDGTDESDNAENYAEHWSESIIPIHDSDETAESCSLESEGGSFEDVEIASVFGIMSIYCNSELHSWRSFKGEDA